MSKKRGYGEGQIVQRGENTWLCRYRVGGRRLAKTVRGTKTEAQRALRDLLHAGDKGEHVEPDKLTLGQWIDHWISIGCPGNKRRREVSTRAIERYSDLLRFHVVPLLGARPLQQVQSTEIDAVYTSSSPTKYRRARHIMCTSSLAPASVRPRGRASCSAIRCWNLPRCPLLPSRITAWCLRRSSYCALVRGFKGTALFPIVAAAAATGARRNEILALQWCDLDIDKKTLRIERAIEETDEHGLRIKGPKTERGKRSITIDDELLSALLRT